MKTIAPIALLVVLAVAHARPQPPPSQRQEQHAWLERFVGEWTVTAEAHMDPETEPMTMESTERVRSIGGLWIVAEGSATFQGVPFTSIMTLGFDPRQKTFVGTWIDTMQPHMWSYLGTLDDARKVLTLTAEGPSFDDPSKTAKYRDAIEWKDADHRVLTSSVQGADGTWTTFMRADYRRKK
jgi:hypothetical protein